MGWEAWDIMLSAKRQYLAYILTLKSIPDEWVTCEKIKWNYHNVLKETMGELVILGAKGISKYNTKFRNHKGKVMGLSI